MQKSPILLGCLVAITASTTALADSNKNATLSFNCRSRGPNITIVLKPNQTYTATDPARTIPGGTYKTAGRAIRFKTGGLQDQSIVSQQGNIYLVATQSEAKAAELAKSDGALFCTKL